MVKIIIISYFFPPANYVGGERTASWAKYLNEQGVFPIIITRNWNDQQLDTLSPIKDNEYKVEKHPHCEIHRLPYHRTLRDKLSTRPKMRWLQKILTLKELIFSNYFVSSIPYNNFYTKSAELMTADLAIKGFILSGRPFQSFAFGHKLKKKFPDRLFIPDYRDEWSTHQNLHIPGIILQLIAKLERKSEKKWTSNCDFFLSTSDAWVENISTFIKKPGYRVMNGFDNDDLSPLAPTTSPHILRITYAGTLYENQQISIFIDSCIALIAKGETKLFIDFVGIDMNIDQKMKVLQLTKNYTAHFSIIDRVPRPKLEEITASSDVMILTGFSGVKGWYPVKLFHYYSIQKPILLCPSDNDVMEEFIHETKAGFVVSSKEDCIRLISALLAKKATNQSIWTPESTALSTHYTRDYQASVLAKVILKKATL
ncbi:MAG: hypothetical protein ACI865_000186 [Flavobacteriaceae bacterium]|jgi:hypothetical protein